MFLKNCWYVAAYDRELEDGGPLGRKLLNEPVVMFRDSAGKAIALDAWAAAGLDAVLCPPHATPAVGHRQSGDFTPAGCYAMRYNFLNLPAGVVPVTRVRDDETQRPAPQGRRPDRVDRKAALVEAGTAGLPVGVQIAAMPYREDLVLALMEAVEAGARATASYPKTPVTPRA